MGRLVVQEFVTVDGYAAGPGGELDFVESSTETDPTSGELVEDQLRFVESIDAILLGAVTYRMFSAFWPDQTVETQGIADALNATPKIVFSRTLESAPWGRWEDARIVDSSASEEVVRLKDELPGDMVVWGSITLAQSLMEENLVDEYHLWVCPAVLGDGKRLFPTGLGTQDLSWLGSTSYEKGPVTLRLAPWS